MISFALALLGRFWAWCSGQVLTKRRHGFIDLTLHFNLNTPTIQTAFELLDLFGLLGYDIAIFEKPVLPEQINEIQIYALEHPRTTSY